MQADSSIRILLALILVCLVILIFQGFSGDREGRYKVNVIRSSNPWLMRVDTATGRVDQFRIKGKAEWVELTGSQGEEAEATPAPDQEESPPATPEPASPQASSQPPAKPRSQAAVPPATRTAARAKPVQVQPESQIEALSQAITPDNPPEIRAWAASQLGNLDAEKTVPILIGALGDSDDTVVVAAIQALRATGDPAGREAVRSLLDHPDPAVQQAARAAVGGE